MKLLIFLLLSLPTQAQLFKRSDIAPMALSMAAGYAQGWRDEVLYHPNQLFRQFPNLNRNFWDIRVQNKPGFLNMELDADHVLKSSVVLFHTVAIALRFGEKPRLKTILINTGKHYLAYKAGHFLAWNVTHKNKL